MRTGQGGAAGAKIQHPLTSAFGSARVKTASDDLGKYLTPALNRVAVVVPKLVIFGPRGYLPRLPLWVMCGRLPFGKGLFEVCATWSGAVMCPALYEAVSMTAGPNAIRRIGSQSQARA